MLKEDEEKTWRRRGEDVEKTWKDTQKEGGLGGRPLSGDRCGVMNGWMDG